MKLYGYWRSSATWRVRIALAYKGLAHEVVPVNIIRDGGEQNQAPYTALNPMRQVPTLELTVDGKALHLAQSIAIIELLEEIHPAPRLLPEDRVLRAKARQLAEIINAGVQPFQNTGTTGYLKELFGDDKGFSRRFIARGLDAFQAGIEETVGRYCIGDEVTLPDLFLVPQLYASRRFGVDVSAYPALLRIEEACMQLPAFQGAHPDRQPDAVKAG
ncbi:maleylacetoacetate isomerase [Chondromyces apiculatus]|uniref:Maleylacetoacetate isomerase n=1 Tax=Chondromyces apiculatus DSM 436 TaxID=1192034 RepID=A0A017T4M1_9BACT|nr:maleylacetoacetate isomerase [Chondromyces apiculatus]EYF04169.1 Maleylacetoacetate isomerase [Chondromyces apiculatus DSM 436]